MRVAWILMLVFAFAIPWEYSLDLGQPAGNVARIGVFCFCAAVPAVLLAGHMRRPVTCNGWFWRCLYGFAAPASGDRSGRDAYEDPRVLSGDDDRLAGVGVINDVLPGTFAH